MSEFHLRDSLASAEFTGRMKDVFAGLGSSQVQCDTADQQAAARLRDSKPDFDKEQLERAGAGAGAGGSRGTIRPARQQDSALDQDQQFKRPRLDRGGRGGRGGGRGGRQPGHVSNPNGYTKYSLADVPELSNQSNSAAAFDFLNSLKKDQELEVKADLSQKMVFKKREKINKSCREGSQMETDGADANEDPVKDITDTSSESAIHVDKKNELRKKSKTKKNSLLSFDEEEDE